MRQGDLVKRDGTWVGLEQEGSVVNRRTDHGMGGSSERGAVALPAMRCGWGVFLITFGLFNR